MNENFKSGFVAIIGRPNVGKSTLMNHLIGQKIAITSKKPQTTRNRIQTVYTCDEGQIVFLDTPGIHKAKNKLGEYMVQVAERTLKEVDAIMWLVEPSTFVGAGERHIAEQLQKVGVPVILIINKIDVLPYFDFDMDKVREYALRRNPRLEIFPISAKTGDGVEELLKELDKFAVESPALFPEGVTTDQPEKQVCAELIREKLLLNLEREVPPGTAVEITRFSERDDGIIDLEATIYCEKASHKGIIIGKGGQEVDKLKEELKKLTGKEVQINIFEVKRPEVDAVIVGQNIARQLEGRVSFRRAVKTAVASTMRMGAEGIKVQVSGRVGGAEMARSETMKEGRIPLHTFRADIDYCLTEALTKVGILGVKVWICQGTVYGKRDLFEIAGASASAQGAGQPSGDRRGPRGDRRGPRGDRGERRGGAPKRNNKQ